MTTRKKWSDFLKQLHKGDKIKIIFSFQGRKKIIGLVGVTRKHANAVFIKIIDLKETYKTFSKKSFKYALAIYNGRTVYLRIEDGGIREVPFEIEKA